MSRLRVYRVNDTFGGVNKELSPHVIPDNTSTVTDNLVLRKNGLEKAKGWEKLLDQVLTDGGATPVTSTVLLIDQLFKNSGGQYLLVFTDHRAYKLNETGDVLVPITTGSYLSTFVDTTSASGQKTLSVDSVSGYQVGDTIIINEDGLREEEGVVDSINSSGTVTPSDTVRYSDDTAENEFDIDEYTLVKSIEITAGITGEERFTFDMQTSYSGYTSYARIYKNGSPLGTEQSTTSETYVEKSEDITENFSAGDTVELWVNTNGGETHGTYVQNFRIKYDGGTVSLDLLDDLEHEHTAAQADVVRRTYGSAIVDADSTTGQAVLNVSHTDQFSVGEEIIIGLGTAREEIKFIYTITADTSLTMTENLEYEHTAAQGDKVYRMEEFSYDAEAVEYDSDVTSDNIYWTDFANAIQVYDGGEYSSNLGGLETGDTISGIGVLSDNVKAKFIRAFEGFMLIAHTTENGTTYPQKIRWSQYDEYEEWANEEDGTGQAGFLTFTGPDWIMKLQQLKREMIIYRERSIEAMSYIGLPDVFAFRRAETGVGLLASKALVDLGDRHIFVGPDDFYSYNGISLTPIGSSSVTREFFDTMNPAKRDKVIAFYIEEEGEIIFCYSTTDNDVADKALCYNIIFDKWSGPRDMDATAFGYYEEQDTKTWDTLSGTWDDQDYAWDSRTLKSNNPINLTGNDDGLVFKFDGVATADGADLTATWESKLFDIGNPGNLKRVQRVRIDSSQTASLVGELYVGTSNFVGETITWHGPYNFNNAAGDSPYCFMDVSGRYIKLRFITTASTDIRGFEIHNVERVFR